MFRLTDILFYRTADQLSIEKTRLAKSKGANEKRQ